MDKYIAAAKAFWEAFAESWKNFLSLVSGKDAELFTYLKDFINNALGIAEETAATDEAE